MPFKINSQSAQNNNFARGLISEYDMKKNNSVIAQNPGNQSSSLFYKMCTINDVTSNTEMGHTSFSTIVDGGFPFFLNTPQGLISKESADYTLLYNIQISSALAGNTNAFEVAKNGTVFYRDCYGYFGYNTYIASTVMFNANINDVITFHFYCDDMSTHPFTIHSGSILKIYKNL